MKKINSIVIFLIILCVYYSQAQIWQDVQDGTDSTGSGIVDMEVYDNKLMVCGAFNYVGNVYTPGIASWSNEKWDSLGLMNFRASIAMTVFNNELYVSGSWNNIGGVANTKHIVRWNGTQWLSAGSTNNDNGNIYALVAYKNQLYVAGNITTQGGKNVNRIARWNGTTWNDVGGGVTGGFASISGLAVYKDQLYVCGDFFYSGGILTRWISRWNGTKWDSLGYGLNGYPSTMVVDTISNVLYVGGPFTKAGNIQAKYVAKWDGVTWSAVGDPIMDCASVMAMYHGELYVGCQPNHATQYDTAMAKWNGTEWKWVKGINDTPTSFAVYKDTLYVTGYFDSVNNIRVNGIARYYSPPDTTVTVQETTIKNEVEYLSNNIPNPSHNSTLIPYYIPAGSKGQLKLYDIKGELIKSYDLVEGNNKLEVSLKKFSNGIYIYVLNIDSGRIVQSKKMVVEK